MSVWTSHHQCVVNASCCISWKCGLVSRPVLSHITLLWQLGQRNFSSAPRCRVQLEGVFSGAADERQTNCLWDQTWDLKPYTLYGKWYLCFVHIFVSVFLTKTSVLLCRWFHVIFQDIIFVDVSIKCRVLLLDGILLLLQLQRNYAEAFLQQPSSTGQWVKSQISSQSARLHLPYRRNSPSSALSWLHWLAYQDFRGLPWLDRPNRWRCGRSCSLISVGVPIVQIYSLWLPWETNQMLLALEYFSKKI